MKCKFLLSTVLSTAILLVTSLTACADTSANFTYKLNSKIGLDFSTFYRGPLKLEKFADNRSSLSGKQLSDSETLPLSADELVYIAIEQGFKQGNGKLVSENHAQVISGDITKFQSEMVEKDGAPHIQVTVRANMKISTGGKQLWQGTAFGRAAVTVDQGVNVALQQALDKFVVSFFVDDYFILQLID